MDKELARKGNEFHSALSRLKTAQASRERQAFFARGGSVCWGYPDVEEGGRRGGRRNALFECDDPVAVAARLNAIMEPVITERLNNDIARLTAQAEAAEAALEEHLAVSGRRTVKP